MLRRFHGSCTTVAHGVRVCRDRFGLGCLFVWIRLTYHQVFRRDGGGLFARKTAINIGRMSARMDTADSAHESTNPPPRPAVAKGVVLGMLADNRFPFVRPSFTM